MQTTLVNWRGSRQSHGDVIAATLREIGQAETGGFPDKLSKSELAALREQLDAAERITAKGGVNFSRAQIDVLLQQRTQGARIEFETLGPYLADYRASNGIMSADTLTPEDAIGLRLAASFREMFPTSRLISLCDDYNAITADGTNTAGVGDFSAEARRNFRSSLVHLLQSVGAIKPNAAPGSDYLLVSEADNLADVEVLVRRLELLGCIERRGEAIIFYNPGVENPLHRSFHLRSAAGKWLCVALDAAGFLKPENLEICHVIVLPDYMRNQQDKLWEILRALQFSPMQYHNIFYDPLLQPAQVASVIEREFAISRG